MFHLVKTTVLHFLQIGIHTGQARGHILTTCSHLRVLFLFVRQGLFKYVFDEYYKGFFFLFA